VSGSYGQAIRLWETDMIQAAAQICLLAAPVITRAQWAEHLPGYPYRPPCAKRQATPAPAPPGPASSGMKAVHSGKCVAARTNAVDAPLQQFRCKGLPASHWTFAKTGTAYRIGNAANGLCLDTRSAEQETIVVQRTCSDSVSQLWELKVRATKDGVTEGQFVQRFSGACLDISGAVTLDGAHAIAWQCSGDPNQLFQIADTALRQ
jgi:hypothetical protein